MSARPSALQHPGQRSARSDLRASPNAFPDQERAVLPVSDAPASRASRGLAPVVMSVLTLATLAALGFFIVSQ